MSTQLERLSLIQSQIDALAIERDRVVAEARDAGASWSAIGKAVGTTKQGAHKRFRQRVANIEQLPLTDPVFDVLWTTPQD
jgi:hypothetical protein